MNAFNQTVNDLWGTQAPQQALQQIAELCQKHTSLPIRMGPDAKSFADEASRPTTEGILSIYGEFSTDDVIVVHFKLIDPCANVRVPAAELIAHLSGLDDKLTIADRIPGEKRGRGLWVQMRVRAIPLSLARTSVFFDKLKHIENLARLIQSEMPVHHSHESLRKLYERFNGVLQPIFPMTPARADGPGEVIAWSEETLDYLTGTGLVAVDAQTESEMSCALAILAHTAQKSNRTLCQPNVHSLPVKQLLELSADAPGIVAVSAVQISMAANPYELSTEIQSMLSIIKSRTTPVLFTGAMEELQNTFSGGQGARHDPLTPAVRHIPDIPVSILTQHMLDSIGVQHGGFSLQATKRLKKQVLLDLQCIRSDDQKRMLPMVVRKVTDDWERGQLEKIRPRRHFFRSANNATETLGGIASNPRVRRFKHIQANYVRTLTAPNLLEYLQRHLLEQDRALKQLTDRLAMEVLTRPISQPIRLWTLGTPATGKSESCFLLSKRLNIPYVNIDLGSFPNYHTCYSQLQGAARSYVGSHKPGRLEQVAKHHCGCLLELSDIDHAPHEVRVFIGDLLLQLLETGESQSAMGAMYNCTNLVIILTMNLPNGGDESLYRHLGFGKGPSFDEIQRSVVGEVKQMLSGALLSRLGAPVLFEPLEGNALARILETSIEKAVIAALQRMGRKPQTVKVTEGLGEQLIGFMKANVKSFGARAILEYGRKLAAKAVLTSLSSRSGGKTDEVIVSIADDNQLQIGK
jgi:hypothetical protein